MTKKRERRTIIPEFNSQVARLYESIQPPADIIRAYNHTASAID